MNIHKYQAKEVLERFGARSSKQVDAFDAGLSTGAGIRTDWARDEIANLFDLPFGELVFRAAEIDDIEFVRTVAAARITMPSSMVRLSAGRESMSETMQALCFLAGANSIFTSDKLLTAANAGGDKDTALFAKLGLRAAGAEIRTAEAAR